MTKNDSLSYADKSEVKTMWNRSKVISTIATKLPTVLAYVQLNCRFLRMTVVWPKTEQIVRFRITVSLRKLETRSASSAS